MRRAFQPEEQPCSQSISAHLKPDGDGTLLTLTHEHVGTLDDPSGFKPQVVMFASRGHGWDHLDPALPRLPHMRPSP
jgi:hypothetical protein